jgi:hypothetical protein
MINIKCGNTAPMEKLTMNQLPLLLSGVLLLGLAGPGCSSAGTPRTPDDSGETINGFTEDSPENIAAAFGDCEGWQTDPGEYPNQLRSGQELRRVTLTDPEAVCNDGTPGVMYVRPATDPQLNDIWSIHLQGGGDCTGYANCAMRWCGHNGYDSSKMSSANLPLNIDATGIYDMDEGNALAEANQVFFYYCSSDIWRGVGVATYSIDQEELEEEWGEELPVELPASYTLYRHGHSILEAGLSQLREGLTADEPDSYEVVMPSLNDAALVVFNGTSAGSSGARINADWVRDLLGPGGTEVVAIFDAAIMPGEGYLPDDDAAALDALWGEIWENLQRTESPMPFTDSSCLDWHAGTDMELLCYQQDWLMLHHITTPFFVRQDLQDEVGIQSILGVDSVDLQPAVAALLADMETLPDTALEGAEMSRAPGVFGPNCENHVGLENLDQWQKTLVEGPDGSTLSFQGAVLAWHQGESVPHIDQPVTPGEQGPGSSCAP